LFRSYAMSGVPDFFSDWASRISPFFYRFSTSASEWVQVDRSFDAFEVVNSGGDCLFLLPPLVLTFISLMPRVPFRPPPLAPFCPSLLALGSRVS